MSDHPAPLSSHDCDLRGLEWMPFHGDRIFASDVWLLAGPEGRCAALSLLWASWKQCPAGSLPAQDRALAQLAGFGMAVELWLTVKEEAMRQWILCSDGRFYHPEVCEAARAAMVKRAEFQEANKNRHSRQKLWRGRQKETAAKLREIGITPPPGASLGTMNRLFGDADVDAAPSTVDVPRDACEMRKTGEDRTNRHAELRSGDEAPQNAKAALWRDGLAALVSLTGQLDGSCRKLLGRLIDVSKAGATEPDHAGLLALIQRAQTERPDNPTVWLMAAARTGGHPKAVHDEDDKFRINAWIGLQPDVKIEPDAMTGEEVSMINGRGVAHHANRIAEAAGFPSDWRGNWDALGRWLREDLDIDTAVFTAIRRKAARLREQGVSIAAVGIFDPEVRNTQAR